jgi:hypothetical protein
VKTKEEIEIPECYFERHPLVVAGSVVLSTVLIGSVLYLFLYKDFYQHGWALVLTPPAVISGFQTLLFILSPYALVFKNKLELKKSMFSNKIWYFNDIERVSEVSNGSFDIIYNDGEVEKMSLGGIKPSHLKQLRDELHKHVYLSLEQRDQLN